MVRRFKARAAAVLKGAAANQSAGRAPAIQAVAGRVAERVPASREPDRAAMPTSQEAVVAGLAVGDPVAVAVGDLVAVAVVEDQNRCRTSVCRAG